MVAIDTTILLQMFTECKHARRYDWNYRKHEETEDTVPILKEPHSEIPEIKKKFKKKKKKNHTQVGENHEDKMATTKTRQMANPK